MKNVQKKIVATFELTLNCKKSITIDLYYFLKNIYYNLFIIILIIIYIFLFQIPSTTRTINDIQSDMAGHDDEGSGRMTDDVDDEEYRIPGSGDGSGDG